MSTRRAALVVLSQLQIVTLAVHPDGDVSDPGPGVEPDPECPEGPVIRRPRDPREAERGEEESTASVETRRRHNTAEVFVDGQGKMDPKAQ